jgi:hypothetical protein
MFLVAGNYTTEIPYQLQRIRNVKSAICCERYVKKLLVETGRDILKKILFITLWME